MLSYDHEMRGVVVTEGPEVSEVKFPHGDRFIMNQNLVDVEPVTGAAEKKSDAKSPAAATDRIDYTANTIVVIAEGNPRSPTAKAFKKWAEMKAYLAVHPRASIKEVSSATSYKIGDFRWDLEKGNVGYEPI